MSQQVDIPLKNNFDLIRLLAASQVVIGHACLLLEPEGYAFLKFLLSWSHYFPGVPIFFTLSGFLVYWSYERNSKEPGQFYRNRLLRIFPGLWVCLLVTILLLLAFGEISLRTFGRTDFLGWVFRQLTFLQFGTPEILKNWGSDSPNRSLWTISIEIQFYLLVPFIYALLERKPKHWVQGWCLAFTLSILCFVIVKQLSPDNIINRVALVSVYSYLFNFLFGIAIFKLWSRIQNILRDRALWWLAIYFTYALIFGKWLNWYEPWPYFPDLFRILGYLLLSLTTISLAFTYSSIGEKILGGFDVSYGLYIYHALVINCFLEYGLVGRWAFVFAVFFISFLIGAISWVYVERPFLSLKYPAKFSSRRATPQAQ